MLEKEIDCCRICGGNDFEEVIDLGKLALTGRFPTESEPPPRSGRLRLIFCPDCGLAQLDRDFDPNELYREPYGYQSSINKSMRDHLKGIVTSILARIELCKGDVVLDIASNDGTLLKAYGEQSCIRIGIDPTVTQFREFYPLGFTAVPSFFNAEVFRQASAGRKAKVITSIAMIYDLPAPHEFVRDIAQSLDANGLWLLEQSHVGLMLSQTAFDTICHEHLEYYGLKQIERLLMAHGLRVFDVKFNAINGGSMQVLACHEGGPFEVSPHVQEARDAEAAQGLDTMDPYIAFRNKVLTARDELRHFITHEHASGKSILVYGASTKGNTVMQFCGLNNFTISAAADRNPAKWGRRTPGTNIPIISEKTARAQHPDYFLVLPWHFKEEFLKREKVYLQSGGKMIFPLAKMTVISAEDVA